MKSTWIIYLFWFARKCSQMGDSPLQISRFQVQLHEPALHMPHAKPIFNPTKFSFLPLYKPYKVIVISALLKISLLVHVLLYAWMQYSRHTKLQLLNRVILPKQSNPEVLNFQLECSEWTEHKKPSILL